MKCLYNRQKCRIGIFGRRILHAYAFFVVLMFISVVNMAIADESYLLGSGDVIAIEIYQEPDLGLSNIRIPQKGIVSMPLVGEIVVEKKTTKELENAIEKKYQAGYLKHPKASVQIIQYRPFFIYGEVRSPGQYPYIEGLTIRKAIALAGGFTDRASESKITKVKEGEQEPVRLSGDLDEKMGAGDVITIGQSLF